MAAHIPYKKHTMVSVVALVDACGTAWRQLRTVERLGGLVVLHSLMLVLLNGGCGGIIGWWSERALHSLMLVLLNGGNNAPNEAQRDSTLHSLMLVLLNGGLRPLHRGKLHTVALVDACVTEWRKRR